jgi:hypothetical protein
MPDTPPKLSRSPCEEELYQNYKTWAEEYARSQGWKINPKEKDLDIILKGLVRNTLRFGVRYCPCVVFAAGILRRTVGLSVPVFITGVKWRKTGVANAYSSSNRRMRSNDDPIPLGRARFPV